MPGRKYSAGTGYRYGFNGKEEDDEVKGDGNQQDYGMRIYDTRLGRFLSVDPLSAAYAELTPYQFASNNPIFNIDLDGLEAVSYRILKMARRLSDIMANNIVKTKIQLSQTNDKNLRAELQVQLTQFQDSYSKIVAFRYKNRMNEQEVLVEQSTDVWGKIEPVVEMTPIGDLYSVITGENFKGDEKSRIIAGVGLLPWAKLGLIGKGGFKMLYKASEGIGKESIEAILKSVNNCSKALDAKHIKAAVGDILGRPVIINGKVYDHLQEVENNLRGIGNEIENLQKLVNRKQVTGDYLEVAQEMIISLTKQKDEISKVLHQAKKAAKK